MMAAKDKKLPPFPEPLRGVWEAFVMLDDARAATFTANPISYVDIQAFIATTGRLLSGWDVELIRRLDQRVLLVNAGAIEDPSTVDGKSPRKNRALLSFLRGRAGGSQ